jgi:DNA helicase IV
MPMTPNQRSHQFDWLERLLGAPKTVHLEEDGLVLQTLIGTRSSPYPPITEELCLRKIGFCYLLRTSCFYLIWFKKIDAQSFLESLEVASRCYWQELYEDSHKELTQGAAHLASSLGPPIQYIRSSLASKLFNELSFLREHIPYLETYSAAQLTISDSIIKLKDFLQNQDDIIKAHNHEWSNQWLEQYPECFKDGDIPQLTTEQLLACVTDNDRVLCSGEAGSGKTTVLLAKTRYLLSSSKAQASEILWLSPCSYSVNHARRKARELNIEPITMHSIHSHAQSIYESIENAPLHDLESSREDRIQWFRDTLLSEARDPEFFKKIKTFYTVHLEEYEPTRHFENRGAYYNYLRGLDLHSLKGERITSLEEMLIANTLCVEGHEYRYRDHYPHPPLRPKQSQYRPSFYLPKLDLYIDYLALSRGGNPFLGMDRKEQHVEIQERQEMHAHYGSSYVQMYGYEGQDGSLRANLIERIAKFAQTHNKALPKQSPVDLTTHFEECAKKDGLALKLHEFFILYKERGAQLKYLPNARKFGLSQKHWLNFLEIFEHILFLYQKDVDPENRCRNDYFIKNVTRKLTQGDFSHTYRYILVDDIQDITPMQASLVEALAQAGPNSVLCATTDPQQHLGPLTGGDLSLSYDFSSHFGSCALFHLNLSHRFKPIQLALARAMNDKTIPPNNFQDKKVSPPDALAVAVFSDIKDEVSLEEACRFIPSSNKVSVSILCHPTHPFHHLRTSLKRGFPHITFHTACNLYELRGECDYLLIIDSMLADLEKQRNRPMSPYLVPLLGTKDAQDTDRVDSWTYFIFTRASRGILILTRPRRQSQTLKHLVTLSGDTLFRSGRPYLGLAKRSSYACPQCVEGTMVFHPKELRQPYRCSLSPYCTQRLNACLKCRTAPMIAQEGAYQCVNASCQQRVYPCPRCEVGQLLERLDSRQRQIRVCARRSHGCRYQEEIHLSSKPKSATLSP